MLPTKIILVLSLAFHPFVCDDSACYGKEASSNLIAIFGDPDEFVKNWENDIKPLINEWMGAGVAVAGFTLVLKSLVK